MNYSNNNFAILPKIRKVLMKYNFALIMALQIMFFSCTKDKVAANLATPKVNSKLNDVKSLNVSDEDVFRAVVYMRGPAASLLGDLTSFSIDKLMDQNSQEYAQAKQMQEKTISELNVKYPGFLKHFRTDIGSGDYNKVNAVLEEASHHVTAISAQLNNRTVEEMNQLSNDFITSNNLSEHSTNDDFLQAAQGIGMCLLLFWIFFVIFIWVIPAVAEAGTVSLDSYLKEDLKAKIVTEFAGV